MNIHQHCCSTLMLSVTGGDASPFELLVDPTGLGADVELTGLPAATTGRATSGDVILVGEPTGSGVRGAMLGDELTGVAELDGRDGRAGDFFTFSIGSGTDATDEFFWDRPLRE